MKVSVIGIAVGLLLGFLIGQVRANDCPPRIPPSQVNCDEARGYVEAIGLRASIRKALRCGYSVKGHRRDREAVRIEVIRQSWRIRGRTDSGIP